MAEQQDASRPEVLSEMLLPGTLVGHFRIRRLVGRGGMGEVFLARDIHLGRKVALKVIHRHAFDSPGAVERFLFEARTTARFNHPNIVTLYEAGEHLGSPFVALEYLEGGNLRQRLREEKLGQLEALRIALCVAEALREAHANRVLHLDLKPENVLIPRDGRVRVVDFGLAAILQKGEATFSFSDVNPALGQTARLDGEGRVLPSEPPRSGGPEATRFVPKPLAATVDATGDEDTLAVPPCIEDMALASAPTVQPHERRPALLPAVTLGSEWEESAPLPSAPRTAGHANRGTPAYMAPEQWLEQKLSGATDVWALGILMHEMLCGERPFSAPTVYALAAEVVSHGPTPLHPSLRNMPEALRQLLTRCLDKVPANRPDAGEAAAVIAELLSRPHRITGREQSPFRGLLSFGERHAELFFGREEEVTAFVERLREAPILPVIGPSGVGKSSFVQAGVVPRLREQGSFMVLNLRPGSDPLRSLAGRLILGESTMGLYTSRPGGPDRPPHGERSAEPSSSSGFDEEEATIAARLRESPQVLNLLLMRLAESNQCRVLLFVDQLEEVFTQVRDEVERRSFLQAICSAADDVQDPIRVIFTLREDFLGRLSAVPHVREALHHVTVLGNPGEQALEEIVRQPVTLAGYAYDDPALPSQMVAEVWSGPAALPLLQFTGAMLWERRDRERRLLLRAVYTELGGVGGALARHADGVLAGLGPGQLALARELLLRLCTGEGTRRTLPRPALLQGLPEGADQVLDRLVAGRLLTLRKTISGSPEENTRGAEGGAEAELELVHESLLGVWERLRRWIEESRDELGFLSEVSQAAELWQRRGRRPTEVWQGEALAEARRSLARCTTRAPALVAEFIEAGVRKEQRRRRGLRLLMVALLVLPTLVALAFMAKERETGRQMMRAEAKEREARIRRAEAQREGARAAHSQGELLQARALLRGSLEGQDSLLGRVLFWQLDRNPLRWRRELGNGVYDLAFSPDGKTLAAASQDSSIYLFDVQTQALRVLRGHRDQVFAVAYSPDGKHLATGGWGREIRLWDLLGDGVRTLTGHTDSVRGLAFSPDGRHLASASSDGTVRLWPLAGEGRGGRILKGHSDTVYTVAFSPDGRLLASASRDETVRVWEMATGKALWTLRGHEQAVEGLAFSPDGALLASGGWDHTIRLWTLGQGSASRMLGSHGANVVALAFLPDGKRLLSASWDRTLRLWDISSGAILRELRGHSGGIYGMAQSMDGRLVATGSWDRSLRLYDLGHGTPREQSGHRAAVYGTAFSPDGRVLATASLDRTVRIWDTDSGEQRQVLTGHDSAVEGVAFSPDGSLLASGSSGQSAFLWDTRSWSRLRVLGGHRGELTMLAFSPDGKHLATGCLDRTIRLWRMPDGAPGAVLEGHSAGVRSLAFSPDGKTLASGSHDQTIRLWSLPDGRVRTELMGHEGAVFGLAFAPDGGSLISGGEDRTVRRWDLQSGRTQVLYTHSGRVYMLDVSPDGRWIGVPGSDGSAVLLPMSGGSPRRLLGHRSEVNYLRFSPDNRSVITTSDDGTVRLWDVSNGRPRWLAPLFLSNPPVLFSHLGETALGPTAAPEGKAWRQAVRERALVGRSSPDSRLLCLHDGASLELWDLSVDRLLLREPLPGLKQVLALGQGCITISRRGALLHPLQAPARVLMPEAVAMALDGADLLLAGASRIVISSPDGTRRRVLPAGPGITALTRAGGWLVLGFSDGTIERRSPDNGARPEPSFPFEGLPSSPVLQLSPGLPGTLLVGYGSGHYGLWSLDNGARLFRGRLHGAVTALFLDGNRLHVATDLGRRETLDLSILRSSTCDLMQRVWSDVPVVWEGGLPRLRKPPDEHPCRRP